MSAQSEHTWTKTTIASTVKWVDSLNNHWVSNFLTEEDQDRFTAQDTVQVLSIKFREDPYAPYTQA
jgi:hypothetical protein